MNFQMLKDKTQLIEIVITASLFVIAIVFDALMTIIIYLLYFIIFLEIVRAVMNYINQEDVNVMFLINAFIILSLREFIVNVVKINEEQITSFDMLLSNPINFNLIVLSGVIIFLFFVKYLSVKTYIDFKKERRK